MQSRLAQVTKVSYLTLTLLLSTTILAQTPTVRSGISSSAERARMEQEKAKLAEGTSAATANSGAAKESPQIMPLGPKKYAPDEILYKNLQQCEGGKSLPDSRYVIDIQKETVLDKQTKLMWKRCPEGLAGEFCELYAPHNPKEQSQSDNHRKWTHTKYLTLRFSELGGAVQRNKNFAGYSGWRIPTIEEFKTLRDENCRAPAANANAFPLGSWGTAQMPGDYWTSNIEHTPSGVQLQFSMSLAEGRKFNLNDPDRRESHSSSIPVRLVRNH
jgi:Protein of unknown function (DUF1566)